MLGGQAKSVASEWTLIIMVLSSFLQYGATTISKCYCELPLMSLLKYQNLIDLYLNSFLSLNSILSLQKTMNQRFLSILNSKKTTHTHRRKKNPNYMYLLMYCLPCHCQYVCKQPSKMQENLNPPQKYKKHQQCSDNQPDPLLYYKMIILITIS